MGHCKLEMRSRLQDLRRDKSQIDPLCLRLCTKSPEMSDRLPLLLSDHGYTIAQVIRELGFLFRNNRPSADQDTLVISATIAGMAHGR